MIVGMERAAPVKADHQPGGDNDTRHRDEFPLIPLFASMLIRHMAV
jgi:hypothetical protein